ncbi:hypothetical protein RY831_32810, partial [Noviherbaspirillum sp. CPCC 100848]
VLQESNNFIDRSYPKLAWSEKTGQVNSTSSKGVPHWFARLLVMTKSVRPALQNLFLLPAELLSSR